MGLVSGSISVSRFQARWVTPPDFDSQAFREIGPNTLLRESIGFLPFEIDAPYEVGARRHAFRVRIDRLRPDPTAVKERLRQLIKTELDTTGARFVGAKKKRELRLLAEEELAEHTSPRSKILEGVIDGDLVYLGTTARSMIGTLQILLRKIGVETDFKTPWLDRGFPEELSDMVVARDAGESIHGCRFLKALVGDDELMVEPEAGRAKLAFASARISLAGEVIPELHEYTQRGAEVLALKLTDGETTFTLDGPTFRLSGVKLPPEPAGHWTEILDGRLTRLAELYDRLDAKFEQLVKLA